MLTKAHEVVFADDIRKVILKLADERGTEKTFRPSDVARAMDKKNWRFLLDQVRLVAGILIHEGKITATGSSNDNDDVQSKSSLRFRKSTGQAH